MHFFNPVSMMPLVEVIRGKQSSDAAIAATVALAQKMGKTPVVVNDCPGFFVNRVLFPYFAGFHMLLRDGADFQVVDKAMEKFGWPMGPAYLLDVVGMDTAVHAAAVMAEGFPDRMRPDYASATTILVDSKRYGQKNSLGYYSYAPDKKGKPKKTPDPQAYELIKGAVAARQRVRSRGDRRALHGPDGERGGPLPRREDRRVARTRPTWRSSTAWASRRSAAAPAGTSTRWAPRTSSRSPTSTSRSASCTRRRSCCATWRPAARSSSAESHAHHESWRDQHEPQSP